MSDSLTAAEQRCLKLVTIAEEQAKEAQRELHRELTAVKKQLQEREELCSTTIEHLSHQMAIVVQDLKRTTDLFAQSHQETTRAIVTSSQQRAGQEASAISNMRSTLHLFFRYGQFMRRRTLREAFLASIRHCSPMAVNAVSLAASRLADTNQVAREALERSGLLDISNIPKLILPGGGEQSGDSSWVAETGPSTEEQGHVTFEQFCEAYQNYRSADMHERAASRKVLSWSPSPRDRQLLEHLLAGTVRRSTLAIGNSLLDNTDEDDSGDRSVAPPPFTCEDVVSVFEAVLVYLCGATDLLDRLGSSLEAQLLEYFRKFESFNKGVLLDEERQLLKLHAERLMKEQVIEIVPRAVSVLLTQKLVDACEERFTFTVEKLREVQQELTESTRRNMDEATSQLVHAVMPLVLEGFYVSPLNRSGSSTTGHSSPQASPPESPNSRRGFLLAFPQQQQLSLPNGSVVNVTESAGQRMLNDLHHLVKSATNLAPRVLALLQDEHASGLKQALHCFEDQLRSIQREFQSKRELKVEQQVTVFRLPQLQSDVQHQQAMREVLVSRLRQQEAMAGDRIRQLELEAANLKSILASQEKALFEVSQARLHAEKELQMLYAVSAERSSIHNVVLQTSEELRCINYTLNAVTFGDGWQKSLLMLREQLHKQCAVEHSRILGEISTVLRRRNATHHAVEQMLDARLAQVLKSVNDDVRRRGELQTVRHQAELQSIRDEHAAVVEELKISSAQALREAREMYEAEFDEKIRAVNSQYEERTRRFQQRERELETYFELKIRQQREKFRRREEELEDRLEHRFQEMHKIFEGELNTLKGQFIEKERKLDRDRLLMEATLEKRVNERVVEQRRWTENICQQLQEMTLAFVRQKQVELESFRESELSSFNNFLRLGLKTAQDQYNALEQQLELATEARVKDAAVTFEKVLGTVKAKHEEELRQRECGFDERLEKQKRLQEEVLRMTQLLRIEQDEAFWQSCFARLVAGEKNMQQKWADVRLELQRRYSSIIDACSDFLNRDCASARRAFDDEMHLRTSHLHEYAHYYHRMQIVVEETLWEEIFTRSYIEREEITEFSSHCIYHLEKRLKGQQLATVAAYREPTIQTVTLDDLRRVRDKYETRLLDQQLLVSQLQRECIASVDIGLKASSEHLRTFEEVAQGRLADIQELLASKADAFHQSRSKVAADSLAQLLLTTESSLYEARRFEEASFFKTVLNHANRNQAADAARRGRGSPDHLPQKRAHSAGAAKGSVYETPARGKAPLGDAMHHHQIMASGVESSPPPQQQQQHHPLQVSKTDGLADADPLSTLTFHDPRMVQYFASMSTVISTSSERFHKNVEQKFSEYEKRRKDLFKHVHEEYVEATSSLMRRLDAVHGEKSVAEAAAAQQSAMLAANEFETKMCLRLLGEQNALSVSQMISNRSTPSAQPTVTLSKNVIDEIATLRERVVLDEWNSGQHVSLDTMIPRSAKVSTPVAAWTGTPAVNTSPPRRAAPTLEQLASEAEASPKPSPRMGNVDDDGADHRKSSPAGVVTPRRSRGKVVLSRPTTPRATAKPRHPSVTTPSRRSSSIVRL